MVKMYQVLFRSSEIKFHRSGWINLFDLICIDMAYHWGVESILFGINQVYQSCHVHSAVQIHCPPSICIKYVNFYWESEGECGCKREGQGEIENVLA